MISKIFTKVAEAINRFRKDPEEEVAEEFERFEQELKDAGVENGLARSKASEAISAYFDIQDALRYFYTGTSAGYRELIEAGAKTRCNNRDGNPGIFTALFCCRDAAADFMSETANRYSEILKSIRIKLDEELEGDPDLVSLGEKLKKVREIKRGLDPDDREFYGAYNILKIFISKVDELKEFTIKQRKNEETGPAVIRFLDKMFADEPLLARLKADGHTSPKPSELSGPG
jgi:hypothetical protein